MPFVLRLLCAAGGGALLLASSPAPRDLSWLAWPGVVVFCLALAEGPVRPAGVRRRGALCGLAFGLAWYVPLLAWIRVVLAVYGGVPVAQAVAVATLLGVYMALYPAVLGWLLAGRPAPLVTACAWVGLDLARGWLLTGFPWLDLAYTQYRHPALLGVTPWLGHHGLTFAMVLAAAGLAALVRRQRPRAAAAGLAVGLAMVVVPAFCGGDGEPAKDILTAALVQGNVDQGEKWRPESLAAAVDHHLALTAGALAAADPPRLVVWPETALPFQLDRRPDIQQRIGTILQPAASWLLAGVPWEEPGPRYYNRAVLLAPDGRVAGHYDKQHLVPFGEFIPLRGWLPVTSPVVATMADFSPGTGNEPLACGDHRLGVLICFEAIFPGLARRQVLAGADLLVNITNDAWFGRTNAPYQHLAMAVLRAAENRRPLLRAANTGISAVIDPWGRITGATPLFTTTVLPARVRPRQDVTFYSRRGHWFGPLCLAAATALLVRRRRTT